jgi:hypothetical protein
LLTLSSQVQPPNLLLLPIHLLIAYITCLIKRIFSLHEYFDCVFPYPLISFLTVIPCILVSHVISFASGLSIKTSPSLKPLLNPLSKDKTCHPSFSYYSISTTYVDFPGKYQHILDVGVWLE